MRTLIITIFSLSLFTISPGTKAADLTDVNQIVTRANQAAYYLGNDGRSLVRMTIIDAQGRKRRREFTVLRKNIRDGGDQDYLIRFSRPADVRNTVFLVKKHIKKDDDRWLYLPDLDLVKRIAAGDKRTSFVGSDYFYEDISGRNLNEDRHELIETNGKCYLIRNTPKDPKSVEFDHYDVCVNKQNFIPQRIDYFDDTGQRYRYVEAIEIQTIQGFPTVTKAKVANDRSGSYTLSEFRNIEYDLGIPDSVFTERSLRNPPRKWFAGPGK